MLLLQQTGAAGSIKAVQLQGGNSNWVGMTNVWGAAWELTNAPAPPLSVHIVGDDGQEVGFLHSCCPAAQAAVKPMC